MTLSCDTWAHNFSLYLNKQFDVGGKVKSKWVRDTHKTKQQQQTNYLLD